MIGFLIVLFSFTTSPEAHAWGRQGHSLIGETSARILGKEFHNDVLHQHSYDVGYYANIPDILWKLTPAERERERFNHYMRWDVYKRKIPTTRDLQAALQMPRVEFNKKYIDIDNEVGRAFWRIREMEEQLTVVARQLKNMVAPKGSAPRGGEQHQAQLGWLKLAGFIAHYVGDLSQPLHVTENEFGPPGDVNLHWFYEDIVIDELTPELRTLVYAQARAQWPGFHKLNESVATLDLLTQLTQYSLQQLPVLLKIDKQVGRDDIAKAARAYRAQTVERMSRSVLVLTEILSRHLDWQDQPNKFFLFDYKPEWVPYPK